MLPIELKFAPLVRAYSCPALEVSEALASNQKIGGTGGTDGQTDEV